MSEEINYRQLLQQQLVKIRKLEARLEQAEAARREPIAIVGMACRLPGGVETPEAFWELMARGEDATSEVPPDRWDAEVLYSPEPGARGKIRTRRGGFLRDVAHFDARFFGLSDREAERMDPQQRLMLEVGWEALERAGVAVARARRERVGVFVGVMNNDYGQRVLNTEGLEGIDPHFMGARANCAIAGRLSYLWGFQGPSLVVDTACSSSLVAVHLACQSLREGESTLALAGGVNLLLSPEASIYLSSSGALSPDGRCRGFDAAADGFGRAEACGVLVLERLADARARGANVLAVIRGSAVGHDGPSSAFTVPNGVAQREVIRQALRAADVAPARVSYLEAHGTGTPMGDPIEAEAMWSALKEGRVGGESLWMGSVKTNLGYAEAASGVVGMMKVVLALRHGQLPPHLHLKTPNPRIDWARMGVTVPRELTAWTPTQGERVAGVTSYGRTGTVAHVVLAEPPARAEAVPGVERPAHLWVVSARSEAALRAQVERHARFLETSPEPLGDLCFTAATGRTHFEHRLAVVGRDAREVREGLLRAASARLAPPVTAAPGVVFVLRSDGPAFPEETRALFDTQPVFREALEAGASASGGLVDGPLLPVLFGGAASDAMARAAGFVRTWALTRLWRAWGVRPEAWEAPGVGAWVAAVAAERVGLAEGLRGALAGTVAPPVVSPVDAAATVRLELDSPAWSTLLTSLGALYVRGVEVDWAAIEPSRVRRRAVLPTYAFQRERYWLTSPRVQASTG
ncbi:type I polyketide synthase [Archangium primigenium]|uniref:type I polyketide synthase n=1 Tax=[Archangium] primigenium TaxID=2792470 RepID=UPI00195C5203|nr:beta-ketoacyl synthase N-terminal-like domain-containing protein [Archangium primigenium]MBM7115272.1 hypothetical protein [Archangium primigenium]